MLYVVTVRVVPFSSLHPWENWVPPGLHGFYRLNGFLKQVVVSRRDVGGPTVE